jgi:hypothetical protein
MRQNSWHQHATLFCKQLQHQQDSLAGVKILLCLLALQAKPFGRTNPTLELLNSTEQNTLLTFYLSTTPPHSASFHRSRHDRAPWRRICDVPSTLE